jgi:hypothetical protein
MRSEEAQFSVRPDLRVCSIFCTALFRIDPSLCRRHCNRVTVLGGSVNAVVVVVVCLFTHVSMSRRCMRAVPVDVCCG